MLGEKIAEQRKKLGLSQEELAEELNISRSTLAGYEAENKKPSYKVLARMAEYFGVTTDYLLELNGGGNTVLGERIAELRKACDMSQKELGEKLGVSASAIGMYEQGRREPNNAMMIAMEKLFGVTVDYLLGVTDSTENAPESSVARKFGNRLRDLRVSEGITQLQMAVNLDTSKSNISKYEAGTVEPGMEKINEIARFFKVTTDYLLGVEGDTMGTEETINEITQRVGRNIRSIREQAGLSQDEFAEGFSVKQPTVANWETGKRQPDLNMLIQIAHFGGTNLDDLVMKDLAPLPLYVRNMVSLRKKCGYSQGELATVLGLQGAGSIDLVESGKCELPVSKLVHLAEFFGVTMDQITKQDLSQEVSGCRQQ